MLIEITLGTLFFLSFEGHKHVLFYEHQYEKVNHKEIN